MNRIRLLFIASLLSISSFHLLNAQTPKENSYEYLLFKKHYQALIEKSSALKDTNDYLFHAFALDKTGRISETITILEKGLITYPGNQSMENMLADMYFRTGQYAAAKPYLEKHKDQDELFIKLIRVLEFSSDYHAAITLLEKRLESDSLNVEYMIRLGDNYEAVEKFLSAREIYKKSLRHNPHDIVTMSKISNILLKTEQYIEAIEICNSALSLDSANRTILKIQGLAAFRKGEFDLAEENFEKLLAYGDTSIVTLKHLGISESKSYDWTGSQDHLHMAFELDSTDYEISFFLGRAYLNSPQPELGIEYLDLADTLLQPSPAILAALYMEKASGYYSMKEYFKALDCYELAYEAKPRPDYLFYMGSLYKYQLNNPKLALIHFEKFLEKLEEKVENGEEKQNRQGISMKKVAQENVEELKEKLFFEGDLDQ